jgi:photosystem II stability/assembly factor-like uncharacterized protein
MKLKNIIILCSILLITVSGIIGYLSFSDYERNSYEKFILSEAQNYNKFEPQYNKDKPNQDRPDKAAFQNYIMTIDPELKRVPSERLIDAYQYAQEITSFKKYSVNASSINWENLGSNMGGRTRAIMYDPNDESGVKVWAGAVTGGLWYIDNITDDHYSWVAVNDFWSNLSISCITYDPNNTDIFYVGTGESHTALTMYRESSSVGHGIMKSEDGGETWANIESTINFAYVNDIRVRNENGTSVIYAAVVSGFYKGQEHQSQPTDGLFRSTDGGSTWTQVLPNIPNEDVPYAPSDIEFTADGRIFVGTMRNLDDKGGATILYSDDGTSGSWIEYDNYRTEIEGNVVSNSIPGRVMLAAAPSNANVLYAAIAVGSRGSGFDGFDKYEANYFLKTINKGTSWEETGLPDGEGRNWAYLAWHALTIAVDPNDADRVFAGGLDLHLTSNAGQTWHKVSDWAAMYSGGGNDYAHADHHYILYKEGTSNEILFGTDGGVFYTTTGHLSQPTFIEKNFNFNTLQFYSCDINPTAGANKYIGGLQDNGSVYYNNAAIENADMVSGGDGALCFYDKDESNVFITSVYNNVYYIFKDEGWYNYVNDFQSGLFINPADYDSETNRIYANATTATGQLADQINVLMGIPETITGQFVFLGTGSMVPFSAVKKSPHSNTLLLGTQAGKLFKVDLSQNPYTQTEITGDNFPVANISSISIGLSDNKILITFSNYGVTSVWESQNGGTSWTNKESNLPDMPVRWSIYHPENDNQVMLATELGIWETININASPVEWTTANEGLANIRVDMIKIREADNKVVAASHGRGLFAGTYIKDESTDIEVVEKINIKAYPNPGNGIINFSEEIVEIKIFDETGRLIHSEKGINNVDISDKNNGIYFIHLASQNRTIKYIKE